MKIKFKNMNLLNENLIIAKVLEFHKTNIGLNISSMCCTARTITFYIAINTIEEIHIIQNLQDLVLDELTLKIQKLKLTKNTASTIITYTLCQ